MPSRPKWTAPLEKNVQALVTSLFKKAGCKVRSTSQYRASHIAEGPADLIVTHRARRIGFWFEVKRPSGRAYNPAFPHAGEPEPLRPAQQEFRDDCLAAGWSHYWGGVTAAEDALIEEGLGHRKGAVFYHGDDPACAPDKMRGILAPLQERRSGKPPAVVRVESPHAVGFIERWKLVAHGLHSGADRPVVQLTEVQHRRLAVTTDRRKELNG